MTKLQSVPFLWWPEDWPFILIIGFFLVNTALWLLNAVFVLNDVLGSLLSLTELYLGLILFPVVLVLGKRYLWATWTSYLALIVCTLWIGLAFVGERFFWMARYWGLERASHRAEPLIKAIESYAKDHGRAPKDLLLLVPDYISAIPTTGLPAEPTFKYKQFFDHDTLLVWDLGPVKGVSAGGPWKYPNDLPTHAILALVSWGPGKIIDARVERLPEKIADIPFDSRKWMVGLNRKNMVKNLMRYHPLTGQYFDAAGLTDWKGRYISDLKSILGSPDRIRSLHPLDWQLHIGYGSFNGNGKDTFFYSSDQRYPKSDRENHRIGNWSYFHAPYISAFD